MKGNLKHTLHHWKKVFGNWKYTTGAILIALAFYLFNVLLINYQNQATFYQSNGFLSSIKFMIAITLGFGQTITALTHTTIIILSILMGMLISLIAYKTIILSGRTQKKEGILPTLGIFLAALLPGCAACGVGIASALGLSAIFIHVLPYQGSELSFIAVAIMIVAIFKTSNDSCKLMKKQMKGGRT